MRSLRVVIAGREKKVVRKGTFPLPPISALGNGGPTSCRGLLSLIAIHSILVPSEIQSPVGELHLASCPVGKATSFPPKHFGETLPSVGQPGLPFHITSILTELVFPKL